MLTMSIHLFGICLAWCSLNFFINNYWQRFWLEKLYKLYLALCIVLRVLKMLTVKLFYRIMNRNLLVMHISIDCLLLVCWRINSWSFAHDSKSNGFSCSVLIQTVPAYITCSTNCRLSVLLHSTAASYNIVSASPNVLFTAFIRILYHIGMSILRCLLDKSLAVLFLTVFIFVTYFVYKVRFFRVYCNRRL